MLIKNGMLFCDDGTFRILDLETNGGQISALGSVTGNEQQVLDATGCYVVPGLVDIHIHGAMGADFSDGETASIQVMAQYLLSQGVTSFLGTSMAPPGERLSHIFRTARPLHAAGNQYGRPLLPPGKAWRPEPRVHHSSGFGFVPETE